MHMGFYCNSHDISLPIQLDMYMYFESCDNISDYHDCYGSEGPSTAQDITALL